CRRKARYTKSQHSLRSSTAPSRAIPTTVLPASFHALTADIMDHSLTSTLLDPATLALVIIAIVVSSAAKWIFGVALLGYPTATSNFQQARDSAGQQDPYYRSTFECSLQRQAQLSSGYFHHSQNSQLEYEASPLMNRGPEHHSQNNNVAHQTTPAPFSHQQSSSMLTRRGSPIIPFENYQPGAQQPQKKSTIANSRVHEQVQQQPAAPMSPMSPFANAQSGGSQSPFAYSQRGGGSQALMESHDFSSYGF
ncbi:hypothetical protein BGX33_003325, partial [Mortierella sp. NVP41]